MGPWTHGGWARGDGRRLGSVDFATDTAEFYREHIDRCRSSSIHLKDGPDPELPGRSSSRRARTSGGGIDAWPPAEAEARTLYFREGGGLSFDPPTDDRRASTPTSAIPPSRCRARLHRHRRCPRSTWSRTSGSPRRGRTCSCTRPSRSRRTSRWPGPISAEAVRLDDRHRCRLDREAHRRLPAGSQHAEASRRRRDVAAAGHAGAATSSSSAAGRCAASSGRASRSPSRSSRGKVESIEFTMPDVNHVFRRGHRVMVQVQSTWFPLIDRNPQTFVDIPTARPRTSGRRRSGSCDRARNRQLSRSTSSRHVDQRSRSGDVERETGFEPATFCGPMSIDSTM